MVDGKRFDWKEFDTLAVPGGSWFEHHNGSAKEPLFLFVASDEPVLKKLDLYKKWCKDAGGAVGRVADAQGRCRPLSSGFVSLSENPC